MKGFCLESELIRYARRGVMWTLPLQTGDLSESYCGYCGVQVAPWAWLKWIGTDPQLHCVYVNVEWVTLCIFCIQS